MNEEELVKQSIKKLGELDSEKLLSVNVTESSANGVQRMTIQIEHGEAKLGFEKAEDSYML